MFKSYFITGIVFSSIGINIVQFNVNQRREAIETIYKEKDRLYSSNYQEVNYHLLSKLADTSSYQQGKIEGIICAVNNMKLKDNESSTVWHEGYYRGMKQVNDQERMAYVRGYEQAGKDHNVQIDEKRMNAKIGEIYKDFLIGESK